MDHLTSSMEDWEADSMLTMCQPWEARDLHQLNKRAYSTNQEKYIIIHIQMKSYMQENKTKKGDSEKQTR